MPHFKFETRFEGPVAGIDEAGRGPLAGPVVAAAVILDRSRAKRRLLRRLDDSKKLTAVDRQAAYLALCDSDAVVIGIGAASAREIDRFNILQATYLGMRRAVAGLAQQAEAVLIDGLPVPGFPVPQEALVKGDARSFSIAAASVIAKVTRDRFMRTAAALHPQYGFERHKGYGTPEHLEALRLHGPCPLHRRSFAPCAQLTLELDEV